MTRYPRLFSAGRIGPLALRNRILMAPMEKNLALPTGAVTRRYVDYCEARAAGGAALILLESMYVHPAGRNHRYQLGIHDDDLVPGYRRPRRGVPPPRSARRGAAAVRWARDLLGGHRHPAAWPRRPCRARR